MKLIFYWHAHGCTKLYNPFFFLTPDSYLITSMLILVTLCTNSNMSIDFSPMAISFFPSLLATLNLFLLHETYIHWLTLQHSRNFWPTFSLTLQTPKFTDLLFRWCSFLMTVALGLHATLILQCNIFTLNSSNQVYTVLSNIPFCHFINTDLTKFCNQIPFLTLTQFGGGGNSTFIKTPQVSTHP